jgi:menaquinone-9 beta-reductase
MDYDIVVVGGGLGGSALAKAMAERGAHVLVLERERQFRERVRGEGMWPWGRAEAKLLGIYDLLCDTCAFEKRWLVGLGPDRDLVGTTPQNLPMLTFYHPEMQEVMLQAAARAGAEVRRAALVKAITWHAPANVLFGADFGIEQVQARLVVGADGRGSAVRKWGKFAVTRDPERLMIAGVMLEDLQGVHEGARYFSINPELGEMAGRWLHSTAPITGSIIPTPMVSRSSETQPRPAILAGGNACRSPSGTSASCAMH